MSRSLRVIVPKLGGGFTIYDTRPVRGSGVGQIMKSDMEPEDKFYRLGQLEGNNGFNAARLDNVLGGMIDRKIAELLE